MIFGRPGSPAGTVRTKRFTFDTDVALRFIKFSDLGNFFSWKYCMDYDILIIEETDIGGVENG